MWLIKLVASSSRCLLTLGVLDAVQTEPAPVVKVGPALEMEIQGHKMNKKEVIFVLFIFSLYRE